MLRHALPFLLVCLSGSAAAAPAPPNQPAGLPQATLAELQKGLTAAVGAHFAFAGGKVVWDRHDHRYWLATLRAKQAGLFVLRCKVKYEFPPEVKKAWKVKDGANWTYRIAVGKAGEARFVEPGGYAAAYPLVCVGDSVVVPIRVNAIDKEHRFELTKDVPAEAAGFRILRETADRGWTVQPGQDFPLRNGAKDVLKVVSTSAGPFRNRSGSATRHNLRAVFDVVKDGKFNLQMRREKDKGGKAQHTWAFGVVPKGRPVTVTMSRWDNHEYRGKSNSYGSVGAAEERVALRVGDRIGVGCGYVTPGLGKVLHPAVEARKALFAPAAGTWRQAPGKK